MENYAFGDEMVFLREQRKEPYMRYGEVSSTAKNTISSQKLLGNNWLCQVVQKGGA